MDTDTTEKLIVMLKTIALGVQPQTREFLYDADARVAAAKTLLEECSRRMDRRILKDLVAGRTAGQGGSR